jgi:hypothetical protein
VASPRGDSRSGPARAGRPDRAAFSGLYLVTAVRSPSDVLAVFGGTVDASGGTSLPIRLPPGAQVRAAGVGGRWLEPGVCQPSEDGVLRLPVAAGGAARFEVRYRLRSEGRGPVGRVRSPEPRLPADGVEVRRRWLFAGDVLPGWPVPAWDHATATDLPEFLGDSPVAWAGGVVSRAPVEDVRVGTARLADALGVATAAALFSLAWAGGRRRHPFCGLLTVLLLLAVGAASLLGPPWWQRAAVVPLLVGLPAVAAMVVARGVRGPATVAPVALALALVGLVQLDTRAQPPAPATVLIVSAGANGREEVIAPKAVLDRLAVAPASPGVVLSASNYAVSVDDAGARVVAKYVVHSLGEGEGVVTLPLAEARLEGVTVNKAAAFPSAPRPGVYTVPLPGKGRHEIEVTFAVPLGGTAPDRELRFGVPECPATRVTADLPAPARQVQVVGRAGRRALVDGDRAKLEVEIGATKAVHLRWREGAGGTASVKVREACLWEVSEAGAELTACYVVRVEQGAVSSLRFDVPAELDPLAVATRPLDPNGTAALRDWTIAVTPGATRPLRVDFQAPVTGGVLVVLTCAPRKVLTRQPALRFPKAVVPGRPAERDAVFGLRAKGVTVDDIGRSDVIDFAPDTLARDREFNKLTELRLDPNTPVRLFRPTPAGNPVLRPTLRVAAELPDATAETVWQIGPSRADASGVVRWSGKDAPELVEFVIPAVKILEVRGPDVAGWSQTGSRVQVWPRRAAKDGELEWVGTVTAPAVPFEAVTPRPADMHLVDNVVRIGAAGGYAARVERDRGWTHLAVSGETLALHTPNPAAPAVRVLLSPAPRAARADELGWLGSLPRSRPRPASAPAEAQPAPPATPKPSPAAAVNPQPSQTWVWPVSAAAGWVIAVAVLALLIARFPRTTWPEQFAVVAGLFGLVVVGYWWVGLGAWVVARVAWLAGHLSARAGRPAAVRS